MCVFSSSLGHNHSRLLNFVSGLMEQDWVMGNNGLLSWTLRVIHYALKYPNKQQRYYVVIDFKFPRLSTCYNNDLILSTSEIQTLILCRQGTARGEICHNININNIFSAIISTDIFLCVFLSLKLLKF